MRILALLISIFATFSADATGRGWQEVSNGGEALYCTGDPFDNVVMFDSYESMARYRLKPKWAQHDLKKSPSEIAAILLSRLPSFSFKLQQLALEMANNFYHEASFAKATELIPILDVGHRIEMPNHCVLIQLIAQRPPQPHESFYYFIDGDSWNFMTAEQQGIAIVHEVLYRIGLSQGRLNSSEATRYVVALLISDKFGYILTEQGKMDVLASANLLGVTPDTSHDISAD